VRHVQNAAVLLFMSLGHQMNALIELGLVLASGLQDPLQPIRACLLGLDQAETIAHCFVIWLFPGGVFH